MTPDELARHEAAHRDLIADLETLSRQEHASPAFASRVLARAVEASDPQRAGLGWVAALLGWAPRRPARLALALVMGLALIGAVPQYLTWFNALRLGVPSRDLHAAQVQERLWQKNFACATRLNRQSHNYAVINGEQVVVVTWACPSGDVLVTVESTERETVQRSIWVSLESEWRTSRLWEYVLPHAVAAETLQRHARKPVAPIASVLCQKWLPNRLIKRRIELADGRCVDEVINPRTGRVLRRQRARCDRDC